MRPKSSGTQIFPKEMSNRTESRANPTQSYNNKMENNEQNNIPTDNESMPDRSAHKQNQL